MSRGASHSTPTPTVVKIGATTRDPRSSTSDVWLTERTLHALLAARRVTDRREFFTLSPPPPRASSTPSPPRGLMAHPPRLVTTPVCPRTGVGSQSTLPPARFWGPAIAIGLPLHIGLPPSHPSYPSP